MDHTLPGYNITDADRREIDGRSLTDALGIDRREVENRKAYTRFDEADVDRLESMEPLFERIASDLVDDFYDHLLSFPEVTSILESSPEQVENLKRAQRQYLLELGSGEYDRAYFDRRARVGKVHDMIDVGPKHYLGSYVVYYDGVLSAVADDATDDLAASADRPDAASTDDEPMVSLSAAREAIDETVERSLSVLKLLTLDQQVAIETYIDSYADVEAELERRNEVAGNVADSLTDLRAQSTAVEDRSADISDLADEQSDAMGEVATEVSSLSATVEEIASNAEEVSATSEAAEAVAADTTETAEAAIDKMQRVDAAADDVTADVEALQDGVKRIDEVVEVINDIADQTNLLALNASIEAATAGEAGDGFAVVANEVKSLAEKSQEEATTIERMVSEIQADSQETVESLETANAEITDGVELVEETVTNLEHIESTIAEANVGIQEVATATDDQAASTEEVAMMTDRTMEQFEEVASEVTAVAEANERLRGSIDEIDAEMTRLADHGDSSD
ncbi:globin-coupled sensor protein [Natrarchaeobaculum sulfurireducens]|uniref:Methyl-accepting chemotaxis protein n=1 Tax=Natrarchaeobaculum sulfurireducens TaxID=2044521 RepID=A0A346PDE7_9EURY|nr:globin-coupled sensor protein [Natrarchaeobaculum sulfurireducens]AXR77542.1 Methyl-accepting chemotaxis protein [Natrarchaeobaculum sulfurireducens]